MSSDNKILSMFSILDLVSKLLFFSNFFIEYFTGAFNLLVWWNSAAMNGLLIIAIESLVKTNRFLLKNSFIHKKIVEKLLVSEAVVRRCSVEKVFLKASQN